MFGLLGLLDFYIFSQFFVKVLSVIYFVLDKSLCKEHTTITHAQLYSIVPYCDRILNETPATFFLWSVPILNPYTTLELTINTIKVYQPSTAVLSTELVCYYVNIFNISLKLFTVVIMFVTK